MANDRQMNFRKLILAGFICVAAIACKKNKDTAITPSLDGYLSISGLKEFVSPNTILELSPKGVALPDGSEPGYYWKLSPTNPSVCTTKVYKAAFSDTLQTCTVYCYAYAAGYTSTSAAAYVTVVKSGKDGSIQGINFPTDKVVTDDATYYYQKIGSQTWIVNNIAEKGRGKAYKNAEVMSDIVGRYYSYDEAVAVCENLSTDSQTWALPTIEDWMTLQSHINSTLTTDSKAGKSLAAALMANATFNTETMWEYRPRVGDITNSSGFSAIPSGYSNLKSYAFDGLFEYATFWTSTKVENSSSEAYCVYLYLEEPELYTRKADMESFGASVRCILK